MMRHPWVQRSLMRGNYRKGKSFIQRIKWRLPACEGSDRQTEISDHQPSSSGRTIWRHSRHNGFKWLFGSIHHPDAHLFIYSTARPFTFIPSFARWPLCSKSRLGSRSLGDISVFLHLVSMADLDLHSIKASQALKRANDSYEASISK